MTLLPVLQSHSATRPPVRPVTLLPVLPATTRLPVRWDVYLTEAARGPARHLCTHLRSHSAARRCDEAGSPVGTIMNSMMTRSRSQHTKAHTHGTPTEVSARYDHTVSRTAAPVRRARARHQPPSADERTTHCHQPHDQRQPGCSPSLVTVRQRGACRSRATGSVSPPCTPELDETAEAAAEAAAVAAGAAAAAAVAVRAGAEISADYLSQHLWPLPRPYTNRASCPRSAGLRRGV